MSALPHTCRAMQAQHMEYIYELQARLPFLWPAIQDSPQAIYRFVYCHANANASERVLTAPFGGVFHLPALGLRLSTRHCMPGAAPSGHCVRLHLAPPIERPPPCYIEHIHAYMDMLFTHVVG